MTKYERKTYMKKWNLAHPERAKEIKKKFILAHPGYNKNWNPEQMDKLRKAWKLANPDYSKFYYVKHRKKLRTEQKQYSFTHRKEANERTRKWKLAHLGYYKQYRQIPKAKENHRKDSKMRKAIRKQFGFIPINKPLENSHGHHIDIKRIIYIPAEMHGYNRHCVLQDKGMNVINKLAFNWLEADELYQHHIKEK